MSTRKRVQVRDVMIDRYIVVDGLMTVHGALDMLKEAGAICVIVEKRDEHDEYGIAVLADIAKKVIAQDRSPNRVNIYEIMSKPVISVAPDMDIRYTARLFNSFGLAVAPVIEHEKVIGVVTYTEIVLEGLAGF